MTVLAPRTVVARNGAQVRDLAAMPLLLQQGHSITQYIVAAPHICWMEPSAVCYHHIYRSWLSLTLFFDLFSLSCGSGSYFSLPLATISTYVFHPVFSLFSINFFLVLPSTLYYSGSSVVVLRAACWLAFSHFARRVLIHCGWHFLRLTTSLYLRCFYLCFLVLL